MKEEDRLYLSSLCRPVTKAQYSTIEVLVAMPMTRWELRIVPCLTGGNASATCLKMLVMRFADVPLLLHFAAQYKFLAIIIIFNNEFV